MAKKPKTSAPVHHNQTVSEAFATILKHNLDSLSHWEEPARSWDDIEGVHQARVSLRRMRSALALFRSAAPRNLTADWSEEMRWAANQLGLARDLDVFITEGLDAVAGKLPLPGEAKLAGIAQRHREAAYEQVRAMLDNERYSRCKENFRQWLEGEAWRQEDLKPKNLKRLDAPILLFSRKVLDRHERLVLEAGTHVNPNDPQEMHQLRIECKKLRYAAEFFTPLFNGMEDFMSHMKGLQDLLGILNDVAVMRQLFQRLLEGESDPEVLQFAGGLVGWRICQYEHIKDTLDARWDEFVHAKHPWWKKSAAKH